MAEQQSADQPTEVSSREGRDFAQWGVYLSDQGEERDPVPTVWSSHFADGDPEADVEVGDMRLPLDVAEAFAERVLAAVRYERAVSTPDGQLRDGLRRVVAADERGLTELAGLVRDAVRAEVESEPLPGGEPR